MYKNNVLFINFVVIFVDIAKFAVRYSSLTYQFSILFLHNEKSMYHCFSLLLQRVSRNEARKNALANYFDKTFYHFFCFKNILLSKPSQFEI
jgi:hypothetical protein